MKMTSKWKVLAVSLAAFVTALVPGARGQGTLVLSNKWNVPAGTRSYLDTANNWPRGIMINRVTGNVLVPMGTATPRVSIMSGVDGSDLGTLNLTGVSGGHAGTFPLDLGGVADDGVIYICSLAVNTPVFQIYRWSSEDPAVVPTLAYGPGQPGPNMVRCGDAVAVRGAGIHTQIIASGTGSGYFTVFTTADGTNFTATQIALPSGLGGSEAARGLAFDGTKDAFYSMIANGTVVHHISFDLVAGTSTLLADIPLSSPGLGISKSTLGGFDFMPCIYDGGASTHRLKVYDITDPAAPAILAGGDMAFPGTPIADGNVTGGTDIGAGMIVALSTHNGVLALSVANVTNPPSITVAPQNRSAYPGAKAALRVKATGSAPLRYQWHRNGTTPIPGATDSSLTFNNVQALDAGDYSVTITNIAGTITSAKAKLTVGAPTGYAAKIISDNPLAYWRLGDVGDAPACDSWGGHDGNYGGVILGQTGFSLIDPDTCARLSPASVSGVSVADNSAFNFIGIAPSFTLEAWAKFDDLTGVQRFFSDWQSSGGGFGFGINGASGLRFTTFGVQDFDLDLTAYGFGSLTTGKWYHFAGVAEAGMFYFYINGQSVGSIAFLGEALPSTMPLFLGRNPSGNEVINGQLDEVAFYGASLTADQVRAHYEARYGANTKPLVRQQPVSVTNYVSLRATFSVQAEGTEPITYQWTKGGVNLLGETMETLTIPSPAAADAGDYRVLLSNSAGTTQSEVAHLAVLAAPTAVYLTPDLVLHLKFDGNYQDASGRANHGTNVGATTFVGGKIGANALHVSTDTAAGTFNYVTLGLRPDLQFSSNVNFSVAFWVRMAVPGEKPGDLPFLCNATNSSYNYGYTFSPSYNGGGWTWSLYNSGKAGAAIDGADNSINDGNWHHLAHTFDRAGNGVTYLDGLQVDSRSVTKAGDIEQDAYGNYGETAQFDLDDMGVWRRVLTPSEIAGLYVAGAINGVTFGSELPKISVRRVGNQVELTWTGGVLQTSGTIDGQYTDLSSAKSPYLVTPDQPKQFYRVRP